MSNLTLIAPFQTLSLNEVAGQFYTHKATFTMNDCNAVPSATTATQIWNLPLLGTGWVVLGAAIYVQTPFVFSNASIVIGELQVGDGSAITTYFATAASQPIQGTGATSSVAAGACYVTNTTVAYPVSTNAQLQFKMTITTGQAFNTATAGEVDFYFRAVNLAQLSYPLSN
jgi:hypothetical protein